MHRLRSYALCLLTTITLSAAAYAQTPLDTSYLRTYAQTRGFMLGRPSQPQVTPDAKAVLFLRAQPRAAKLGLFEFDVATGTTRELWTPGQVLKGAEEKLSPEEKAQRERMRVSVGGFTSFQLSPDGKHILLALSGRLYLVERDKGTVRELPTGPGPPLDPHFSPDGARVAYVRDNDVHVLDLAAQKVTRVTTGGTDALQHGLAEFVAQEEMARFSGYWWSPDGKQIAYQETDQKAVEIWYVADPAFPGRTPTPFFYPRPGKPNARVRLGVISALGGSTTWVSWDDKQYPYLATVRWPRGGPLLLAVQTRDQKELVLLSADAATGKTTPILTERSRAWVNIHQEVPHWLPGGKGLLWITERTDGLQLELRNLQGRLKRVLVPEEAGLQSLLSVDAKGDQIVYTASTNPTQSHVYRLRFGDVWADPELLSKEPGLHTAALSLDHSVYVRTSRLLRAMPTTTVHRDRRQADRRAAVGRGGSEGDAARRADDGRPPRLPRRGGLAVQLRPKQTLPGAGGCLRRADASARRRVDESLAARSVVRRPGLHRGEHRRPGHAGPRPVLGVVAVRLFRDAAAARPGGRPESARREVPRNGPRPGRHRRVVIRRLPRRTRGDAPSRRIPRGRRRCPGVRLARLRHALHRALSRRADRPRRRGLSQQFAVDLRREPEAAAAADARDRGR
jgi:WD40 repeat protein